MESLPLLTTGPDADGSPGPTFSRFVLPFGYWPQSVDAVSGGPCYRPFARPNDRLRRRHLTPETGHVLFERALWLELRDAPDERGRREYRLPPAGPDGSESVIAALHAAPRLVLFEWPGATLRAEAPDAPEQPDLLHTGFLVLDVDLLPHQGRAPTLREHTQFNELFRWWQRPYEGYGRHGWAPFMGHAPDDDAPALYLERWAALLDHPLVDERGRTFRLFPRAWSETARHRVPCQASRCPDARCRPRRHDVDWAVYPDTRTFVWTCAQLEGGVPAAAATLETLPYEWARFLNVDTQTRGAVSAFEQRWAKERTYDRWLHAGTLYGVCSHAGALLGNSGAGLPLQRHFAELYFDQTLLLLYLRVSTLRFSRALSAISSRARDAGAGWRRRFAEEFQGLRADFALCTNLYRFPLISHQQQGIELYSLARRSLDVEELFAEIQSEVHTTDEFLNGATQGDHATMATRLTVVATVALGLGLGLDFLMFDKPLAGLFEPARWATLLAAGLAFFGVLLVFVLPFSRELGLLFERVERSRREWRTQADSRGAPEQRHP
jgi:hypothetical protein